jgi:acetylornithine deacetylase
MKIDAYHKMAVNLLKEIIAIPSISREEKDVAEHLADFLSGRGLKVNRKYNNLWVSHQISENLPTVLMNSHIDTVKPVNGWSRDPFNPETEVSRIYGLGSNDAGGPLVSLLASFLYLTGNCELPFNLVFAATAEEEVSGKHGISCILEDLGDIGMGIVGEPTTCKMAVAEKGLMVLDCESKGVSAHAATGEGTNAIYEAVPDMEWFREYKFEKRSKWLGEVKMQVTLIEAGTQHNVVPDSCRFVVDVRTNECYRNEEVFAVIEENLNCGVKARSFRLNPSSISEEHPVVQRGRSMGLEAYGSLTLSDQALMPFTTLKIGPGDWLRSHTADEFITIDEIHEGINTYVRLLDGLQLPNE